MKFIPNQLILSDKIFTLLRDLIHSHGGIYYADNQKEVLADKLGVRVIERGFDSFLDYFYYLKYDNNTAEEWKNVMDSLAVSETFFNREYDQIKALAELFVPQYFDRDNRLKLWRDIPNRSLRIWCAACATGEEPISIAMALNENGWFERAPITIYGTDASQGAVNKAKMGLYGQRSFRNFPPELQHKYFTQEGEGCWRVVPEIHSRIHWGTVNLRSQPEAEALASSPIIFCRNVFIYFSDDAIRETVGMFAKFMPEPAYLFVAASESLLRLTTDFDLQQIGGAFVYVKK
ncbi:MAG TPA: protein-glutamate O-methyltransferase CheR [Oscillatoriaceae cyanobacterium M33_DOE_052]|uniref:protein-glutamate O-methyltransferase n=1 Tax=Planktothricoides sp. SpSt-374 TaxID=2282167 RepID=A0A7C3VEU0_9CYAN|nr:protein-glutamate O-methyltransferase CheR [Oscillatoriaceae cyanobacterium M33_DOE_052]